LRPPGLNAQLRVQVGATARVSSADRLTVIRPSLWVR
jgi:hypothetical protein